MVKVIFSIKWSEKRCVLLSPSHVVPFPEGYIFDQDVPAVFSVIGRLRSFIPGFNVHNC